MPIRCAMRFAKRESPRLRHRDLTRLNPRIAIDARDERDRN
jgi:hypothetical protein